MKKKKKKNISNLSSSEFAHRAIKIKKMISVSAALIISAEKNDTGLSVVAHLFKACMLCI